MKFVIVGIFINHSNKHIRRLLLLNFECTDAGAAFGSKAPLRAEIINLLAKRLLGVTDIASCLKRHKGQISEACAKMYDDGVLDRNEDKTYCVMNSRISM